MFEIISSTNKFWIGAVIMIFRNTTPPIIASISIARYISIPTKMCVSLLLMPCLALFKLIMSFSLRFERDHCLCPFLFYFLMFLNFYLLYVELFEKILYQYLFTYFMLLVLFYLLLLVCLFGMKSFFVFINLYFLETWFQ